MLQMSKLLTNQLLFHKDIYPETLLVFIVLTDLHYFYLVTPSVWVGREGKIQENCQ